MSTTPFPLPIMLNPADRKALRARAHHLDPVVMIGDAGLTRAVLDETDRALRAHELIKVRVLGDDRAQRQAVLTEICSALGCAPVQAIGKLLVLYRPKPIEDVSDAARRAPHVPKKRAAAEAGAAAKKRAAKAPGLPAKKRAAEAPTQAARKRAATAPASPAKKRSTRGNSSAAGPRAGGNARGASGTRGRGAAAGSRQGAQAMKSMKVAKRESGEPAAKAAAGPGASGTASRATQGKRTAVGARARIPSRHGAPSPASQGPAGLQGRTPSATRAGARARARKG